MTDSLALLCSSFLCGFDSSGSHVSFNVFFADDSCFCLCFYNGRCRVDQNSVFLL